MIVLHNPGAVAHLVAPDSGAIHCDHGKHLLTDCTECTKTADWAGHSHNIARVLWWTIAGTIGLVFWGAVIWVLWAVL